MGDVKIQYMGGRMVVRTQDDVQGGQTGKVIYFSEGRGEEKSTFVAQGARVEFKNMGGNGKFVSEDANFKGLSILMSGNAYRDEYDFKSSQFDDLKIDAGDGKDAVSLTFCDANVTWVTDGADEMKVRGGTVTTKIIASNSAASDDAPLGYLDIVEMIEHFRVSLMRVASNLGSSSWSGDRDTFSYALQYASERVSGNEDSGVWRRNDLNMLVRSDIRGSVEAPLESILNAISSATLSEPKKYLLKSYLGIALTQACAAVPSDDRQCDVKVHVDTIEERCKPENSPYKEIRRNIGEIGKTAEKAIQVFKDVVDEVEKEAPQRK